MFNWLKGYSPKQIKKACQEFAHYLGRAAAAGWVAADRLLRGLPFATDEAKWITIHPNGKGYNNSGEKIKGTPLLIDDKTKAVIAGAGGKFNGQPLKAMTAPDYPAQAANITTSNDPAPKKSNTAQNVVAHKQQRPLGSITQRQAQAQEILQRLRANPVPLNANSTNDLVRWLKSVVPHAKCDGFNYLTPKEAREWAIGMDLMFHEFPAVAQSFKSFTNISAKYDQYRKDSAAYQQELQQAIDNIRADRAQMQKTTTAVTNSVRSKMAKMFAEDQNISVLNKFNYDNHLLTAQHEIVRNLKKIAGNAKTLRELSAQQRSAVTNLFIKAATTVHVEKQAYQLLFNKGIKKPEYPADVTVLKDENGTLLYATGLFDALNQEVWTGTRFFGNTARRDFSDEYARGIRENFHPPVKQGISYIAATSAHELAHCLDYTFRFGPNYFRSVDDNTIKEAYHKYLSHHNLTKGTAKDGPYAAYDEREFFAESIVEALTSPAPSQLAQDMLAYAKKLHDAYLREVPQ